MEIGHIRALTIGLNIVEKELKKIITDLEEIGNNNNEKNDSPGKEIDTEVKAKILAAASSTLQEIWQVRQKFGLESSQEFRGWRRRLHGHLIEISNIVYDLRPKTLESYGKLTEEDKEALNTAVEELIRKVNSIYDASQ